MREEVPLTVNGRLPSKVKQPRVLGVEGIQLTPIPVVCTALTNLGIDVGKILYIRNRSLICYRFHCSYLISYENRLYLHLRHYSLRVGHFGRLPPTSIPGIVVERSDFSASLLTTVSGVPAINPISLNDFSLRAQSIFSNFAFP